MYFDTCLKGKLLLLEAAAEAYADPRVIERTEAELKRKAEEKGKRYFGIPHETKRWRMIAGNVMLNLIADEER